MCAQRPQRTPGWACTAPACAAASPWDKRHQGPRWQICTLLFASCGLRSHAQRQGGWKAAAKQARLCRLSLRSHQWLESWCPRRPGVACSSQRALARRALPQRDPSCWLPYCPAVRQRLESPPGDSAPPKECSCNATVCTLLHARAVHVSPHTPRSRKVHKGVLVCRGFLPPQSAVRRGIGIALRLALPRMSIVGPLQPTKSGARAGAAGSASNSHMCAQTRLGPTWARQAHCTAAVVPSRDNVASIGHCTAHSLSGNKRKRNHASAEVT